MQISENNLSKRRSKRNKATSSKCLQEILLELMKERKVEAADIHRATGISYSTINDWVKRKSKSQLLDGNILALSMDFNISISYLAFGVGDEGPFSMDLESSIG